MCARDVGNVIISEWQDFVDPVGKVQHKFGNVYYHANAPCVQVRWPNFESSWVQVSDVVILKSIWITSTDTFLVFTLIKWKFGFMSVVELCLIFTIYILCF